MQEAITIGSAMHRVASANIRCMNQTTLLDFASGHTTNSVTECGVAVVMKLNQQKSAMQCPKYFRAHL